MPDDKQQQESNKTGAVIDDYGTGKVYFPDYSKKGTAKPNTPLTKAEEEEEVLNKVGALLSKSGQAFDSAMGGGAGIPSPIKAEARVGQAPQQLNVPFNPSGTPGPLPTPSVPPPAGGPPRTGPGVIPSEFGSKSAKQGAVVGSAIDNISQAIHTFKTKKDSDALAKAQNTWQLFQTALQQGDQHTANLLATDPKIIKGWEKYLKMEFPREPGTPEKKPEGTVQPDRSMMDKMRGRNKEPLSRLPDMNTPGGIAIPRPGPEAQLHTAQVQTMLDGLKSGDPRAIAAVYGENYTLTPDEFRTASRIHNGFELSPVQVAAMDEHSKLVLLKSKADFMKFVTGQSIVTDRAESVANIQGAWRLAGDEARANATRDAARLRADAIKSIRGSSADKMNDIIMKSNMDMYSKMAASLSTAGAGLIKNDHKKEGQALIDEARGYTQKSDEIRTRMEALKDLKDLGIDMEGLDDDPEINEEP